MHKHRKLNRREFIQHTGTTAAGLTAAGWLTRSAAAQSQPSGANERVRLAFIGTRGQGQFNLRVFLQEPHVDVAVVCDVDMVEAEAARKITKDRAEMVQDYRTLLDRKDIDAFVICTPDHWHAIPTIQGCQAGKDVYVEKPMTLCIAEGQRMVRAARKYNRVVQCGTQQHSGEHYQQAAEMIQKGTLGKVHHVRAWNIDSRYPGVGKKPTRKPPETLNWDMWLGPRPWREYDPLRCSGSHRFFWDYAGGTLTDWGTHHMETVQHCMGVKGPLSAVAAGGKLAMNEAFDTPDTLNVLWEYPGWTAEFINREGNAYNKEGSPYGILFHGTRATLYIDRSGFEVIPEGDRAPAQVVGTPRKDNFMPELLSQRHIRNFLDCMRSRRRPNADVEIGHRATTVPHLGNIAYRTGRKIRWDVEKEQIVGDDEASALLTRTYRGPYLLPEV